MEKKTIKQIKAEQKRLYALGYYEDETWTYRCSNCHEKRDIVRCDCEFCKGACEECAGIKRK